MATETTQYISNPFKMISPSANALNSNIGTLFALLGLQLSPLLLVIIAVVIGFGGRGSVIATSIAAILGFASVVALIVLAFLALPTFTIILLASSNNQKVALRPTLVQAKSFVWRSFGISILTVLAVMGGLILFVVPGIIFAVWFILGQYTLINENLGVVASMKRSRELVRGRFWETWSLSLVPSVAYFVPFVGGILNFVLSVIMVPAMAIRYRQLAATPPEDRPSVHWSNYAVVVLMGLFILALIIFAAIGFIDVLNNMSTPTY